MQISRTTDAVELMGAEQLWLPFRNHQSGKKPCYLWESLTLWSETTSIEEPTTRGEMLFIVRKRTVIIFMVDSITSLVGLLAAASLVVAVTG